MADHILPFSAEQYRRFREQLDEFQALQLDALVFGQLGEEYGNVYYRDPTSWRVLLPTVGWGLGIFALVMIGLKTYEVLK